MLEIVVQTEDSNIINTFDNQNEVNEQESKQASKQEKEKDKYTINEIRKKKKPK